MELLETGIVVDLLVSSRRAADNCSAAPVGKTAVPGEMINNIAAVSVVASVFAGVGERTREGNVTCTG